MKIVDERKSKPTVFFADIKRGECFIDDDGDVIMKIDEWGNNNAVDLADGSIYNLDPSTEVMPIKASIIIHD